MLTSLLNELATLTVLLLDEPVGGLDPEGIQWVRTLMRQFSDGANSLHRQSSALSRVCR
jgi:ABC-2 type transport system ATP-binding protein